MSENINQILKEDYYKIEEAKETNSHNFLNKFNIQSIVAILKSEENYIEIAKEKEEEKRKDTRDKLISFFEYFDKDKTGFINSVHLKQFLVNSLKLMDNQEFETLFFESEIEGAGYIDYMTYAYRRIPEK